MKLRIHHQTRYHFEAPLSGGVQQIRMTPQNAAGQNVIEWHTEFDNAKEQVRYFDHFRNQVQLVKLQGGTNEVTITSSGTVDVTQETGVMGITEDRAPLWLYAKATKRTEAKTGVRALIKGLGGENRLDLMHALMARVRAAIAYEIGASEASWTAEDALLAKSGVCQDHAHAFLAAARAMDVPCRYVSGYLAIDGQIEQTAMHAWCEAHVDELGWVGFDPANGVSPDGRYVRVAVGLDYEDAAPIRGSRSGGMGETHDVQITVAQQ